MRKIIFILTIILSSTEAFSKIYSWKCNDEVSMSNVKNKIQSVEKNENNFVDVLIDTKEGFLTFFHSTNDIVRSAVESKPIESAIIVKKISINNDNIVATYKSLKDKYPNEYIFNLHLKKRELVLITTNNNNRYTRYFNCVEDIPKK
jgi:hypothetical protein